MQCDRAQEFFSDYLERTLDRPMTVALESHLAGCASCRAEIEALQAICFALDSVPEVEPPADGAWQVMSHLRAERAKQYEEQRRKAPTFLEWLRSLNPLSVAMGASLATLVIGGTFAFTRFNNPGETQLNPFVALRHNTSSGRTPAGSEMPGIEVNLGAATASGLPLELKVTPAIDLPDGQVQVIGTGLPVSPLATGSMRQGSPLAFPLTIPPGTNVQQLQVKTSSRSKSRQYEQLVVVPLGAQQSGPFSANLYRTAPEQALSRLTPALGRPVVVDGSPTAPVTLQVDEQPASRCLQNIAAQIGYTVRDEAGIYHLVPQQ